MSQTNNVTEDQRLAEFNEQLMSESDLSAFVGGSGSVTAFVEWVGEKLDDFGFLHAENTNHIGFLNSARGVRADAWNYDDRTGLLTLIIADYSTEKEVGVLNSEAVRTAFRRVERFADIAQTEEFRRALDPAAPAYSFVVFLHEKINRIANVQYVLLSNKRLGSRIAKDVLERGTNGLGRGFAVRYDVWDLERLAKMLVEQPELVVDCRKVDPNGIPCLTGTSVSNGIYSAYLAIMPGVFLAELYSEFNERLLEQNVRTFLQFTGGVNKGIKKTLTDEPKMFFAFNNGITATAESVELNEAKDRILSIKNLQIVNGGQTLASIFNVWRLRRYDLSNVSVQMKLNVLNEDDCESVVPRIALYANTQNKVRVDDFSSNHPFHKRIQEFSRGTSVRLPGDLHDTYWFYERVRGQYNNALTIFKTQSQKDKFKAANPKKLRFQKTDLAKFLLTWDMKPWIVSKGAQSCFGYFANALKDEWPADSTEASVWDAVDGKYHLLFFKELIAKAIFYQTVDELVKSQSDTWYKGFKANIITYTIAKLVHILTERGLVYDLESVWNAQKLSSAMQKFLLVVAERVNKEIVERSSAEGRNPTEMCKQESFWTVVKKLDVPVTINLGKECIPVAKHDAQMATAAAKQRAHRETLPHDFAVEKGVLYWNELGEWCKVNMRESYLPAQRVFAKAVKPDLLPNLMKNEYRLLMSVSDAAVAVGFKEGGSED